MAGSLKPGDKLPSIPELQEMLGAGRGTLREAFRGLQQQGLIEARIGPKGGYFVQEVTPDQAGKSLGLLIRYKRISLKDLFKFRQDLEVPAAALAAQKAQKKDIQNMKRLLAALEEQLKGTPAQWLEFYNQEALLHIALAKMTRNLLYESVLATIHENNRFYHDYLTDDHEGMRATLNDWHRIIEALEKGRAGETSQAIEVHINRFVNRL